MQFDKFGSASDDLILQLEAELDRQLPAQYRAFLQKMNGGVVRGLTFELPEVGSQIELDVLFGLGLQRGTDLLFWNKEFLDDIPRESVLIGTDPFGNYFLLSWQDDMSGVHYYDHTYALASSSDDQNTYLIAKDFQEFISPLMRSL